MKTSSISQLPAIHNPINLLFQFQRPIRGFWCSPLEFHRSRIPTQTANRRRNLPLRAHARSRITRTQVKPYFLLLLPQFVNFLSLQLSWPRLGGFREFEANPRTRRESSLLARGCECELDGTISPNELKQWEHYSARAVILVVVDGIKSCEDSLKYIVRAHITNLSRSK